MPSSTTGWVSLHTAIAFSLYKSQGIPHSLTTWQKKKKKREHLLTYSLSKKIIYHTIGSTSSPPPPTLHSLPLKIPLSETSSPALRQPTTLRLSNDGPSKTASFAKPAPKQPPPPTVLVLQASNISKSSPYPTSQD